MTMDDHGIAMGCRGRSWHIRMGDHGMSMVTRGMAMGHQGLSRATMALPWMTMDDHG